MANDVFTTKTNVKVEFEIPVTGSLVWGVGSWDNYNWGATAANTWTDVICDTFDITFSNGCSLENGVFPQPSSSTAHIKLTGADYDPFNNNLIHAGTPVRISIQPDPDTFPLIWDIIWQGTVRNFSASYNQKGVNQIDIEGVDTMQDFLNTRVASYTIPVGGAYPANVLSDLANTYLNGLNANFLPDIALMAAKTYTNVRVGDIVKDCLTAGLGALWLQRDGSLQYRSEADLADLSAGYNFYFSTTHSLAADHICMTDLAMKADSRDLPNEIIATYVGGSQLTLRNQDAYDLYGAVSLTVDLPFDNATDTQAWLDRLNLTTQLRRVQGISFSSIKRLGQLWDWYLSDRLFTSNKIGYSINGISFVDNYFITKQTDHLTPTTWSITLELWRGI